MDFDANLVAVLFARVSWVVSWVEPPSGSICSTSTPTVTDCTGKPRASLAAASAISPKPVPGMTGWPCTLWSAIQGTRSVPTSACQT